ncbi:hypothetical protein V6N11_067161 [Hibiscus sabdariffa]|uniref:Uncharacterized protein n=1 Tax=Hibiscus sabdariffa TaxID=183260 RepID=A0ABR2SQV9_9ROSI
MEGFSGAHENGYDKASGQKHEHKPVTLEHRDEFEPGARSRFRRLKDVHKYLRARKGQKNNHQPHESQPESNHEQASGQKHEHTPILVCRVNTIFPTPPISSISS